MCIRDSLALLTSYASRAEAMAMLLAVVAVASYALWWLELRRGAPRAAGMADGRPAE